MTLRVPKPAFAREAVLNPEAFHRAGEGLPPHYATDAAVRQQLRLLERRGVTIHVEWLLAPTHCRYRNIDTTIGTIRISLQLPADVDQMLRLPDIRTEFGDGALYSPSAQHWLEYRGRASPLWQKLLAAAPDVPWDDARRWTRVDLTITDPLQWLAALTTLLDKTRGAEKAQPDLFA